jgi:hypothetical protein
MSLKSGQKVTTIPGPDVLAPANVGDDQLQDNARDGIPVFWGQQNEHCPNQEQLDDAERQDKAGTHELRTSGNGPDYGGNYSNKGGPSKGTPTQSDKFGDDDISAGTDR